MKISSFKYLKVNRFHPCFWAHLGLKYFRLPKFIQKIDPNASLIKKNDWFRHTIDAKTNVLINLIIKSRLILAMSVGL